MASQPPKADHWGQIPTENGIKLYPPDGLYEEIACTCKDSCTYGCGGKCGCSACLQGWCDANEWDA